MNKLFQYNLTVSVIELKAAYIQPPHLQQNKRLFGDFGFKIKVQIVFNIKY